MKIKYIYTKLITESVKYGPRAMAECDCCKYFDFAMLPQWYGGYNHPIYYVINKGKEEALEFMSPEEYLQICAKNAGIPYEKYITPGPGSAVSDKYKEYAQRMKNGEKAPIGFYTRGKSSQEGRHRALAAMELGCNRIPVIVIRDVSNEEIREMVLDYKDMTREELDDSYKAWGYLGITDLDWSELQSYIKYRL